MFYISSLPNKPFNLADIEDSISSDKKFQSGILHLFKLFKEFNLTAKLERFLRENTKG